jgi:hypothetical protein
MKQRVSQAMSTHASNWIGTRGPKTGEWRKLHVSGENSLALARRQQTEPVGAAGSHQAPRASERVGAVGRSGGHPNKPAPTGAGLTRTCWEPLWALPGAPSGAIAAALAPAGTEKIPPAQKRVLKKSSDGLRTCAPLTCATMETNGGRVRTPSIFRGVSLTRSQPPRVASCYNLIKPNVWPGPCPCAYTSHNLYENKRNLLRRKIWFSQGLSPATAARHTMTYKHQAT